jgi:FKBP-type peptidyl-prolyl cis-trans isomerase FklB
VIEEGDGEKPTTDDSVKVHYTGELISGEVFDSSRERGEPVTFRLEQVIPGWTEGLQLMPEGSRYKLYIPADLAYGQGGNQRIGPNETLIFDVELLEVNPES